jgi:tRNA 2-thiocytidine biosynthesis protein TtcA
MNVIEHNFNEDESGGEVVPDELSSSTMSRTSRRFEMLEKTIRRSTGKAIMEFNMIEEGDLVMV